MSIIKPTQMANMHFQYAWNCIARTKGDATDVQNCLSAMSQGHEWMAIGLRATYMKLEEIEALLKKQNAARK